MKIPVKSSDDNIFEELTGQLGKDDNTLSAMIQALLDYEANLVLLKPGSQEILTAYGLDLQVPVRVRQHLQKLLKGT